MPSRLKKRNKQSGVVSIEFALGFGLFWLLIVAWLEVSYISYVTALNDLAISEAAQAAKRGDKDYLAVYQGVLDKQDSIWNALVDVEQVEYSVKFVKDIDALSTFEEDCEPDEDAAEGATEPCSDPTEQAIAIYHMSYRFSGLFSSLLNGKLTADREIIVVQEYERDQFDYF